MQLATMVKGMRGRIERLPAGEIRSHFIRIGLVEGAIVSCMEKLPGGTIVLEFSRQEVALSGDLARSIEISQL
ncbi:MAG: ferrous iron transport protein A [Bacteroidetes bacterium]|nr:ferrous iron transport protein A [Bacteroidota bacterium]